MGIALWLDLWPPPLDWRAPVSGAPIVDISE
jgi:hypothetical protein